MTGFLVRARVATVVAVVFALLVAGVAAGAAGAALIIGQTNDGETSQTVLLNAGTGASFTLKTTNVSTGASGIFGWSSSTAGNATRGVYGRADGENSYGVYARNASVNEGTGAAIYADGGQNEGVYATSADTTALRGLVTGCDGFLCGGNGVSGDGYGFAAGVFGEGVDTIAGVWAQGGLAAAVYATQSATDVAAVYADSAAGTGVVGYGEGGVSITETTPAGGWFSGPNGVYGQTDVGFGTGVLARANGALNWALRVDGFTFLDGNLDISGTCTGCTAAMMAINGSGTSLKQGDAVALDGVTLADDGRIVAIVRAAKKNDVVIGVVDRELKAAPDSITIGGGTRTINVNREGETQITARARTLTAPASIWQQGGTSVAAGGYLRIITGGVFAFSGTAPAGAGVGDRLAVSDTSGKLTKAAAGDAATAGRFLGTLKDGRVVILVSPN